MQTFKEWISSPEYRELVEMMQKAQDEQIKDLENNLSQDMVTDIRDWRVGDGPDDTKTHSWRGVARLFAEKYPEFSNNHGIITGNQICGMQLCEVAQKLLNQKTEEGWN